MAVHLRSTAQLLAGLVGFTFLLALGTLSVLLGRFVLDPLSDMVAAVREISRGDYKARASVPPGDELGILAAAFNDMSARIESSTSALSEQVSICPFMDGGLGDHRQRRCRRAGVPLDRRAPADVQQIDSQDGVALGVRM